MSKKRFLQLAIHRAIMAFCNGYDELRFFGITLTIEHVAGDEYRVLLPAQPEEDGLYLDREIYRFNGQQAAQQLLMTA